MLGCFRSVQRRESCLTTQLRCEQCCLHRFSLSLKWKDAQSEHVAHLSSESFKTSPPIVWPPLHRHVRQAENWNWNLLIMKFSVLMTWCTDPGMGNGIWNESVSTIPRIESRNHPCRRATKTNKTQDERFPGCHAARRHLTVEKKTCTHGEWNANDVFVVILSFRTLRQQAKEGKSEVEESGIERDRGVICRFPCYLWLQLCHITFKYAACAHFIPKGSIWNHNGPSV